MKTFKVMKKKVPMVDSNHIQTEVSHHKSSNIERTLEIPEQRLNMCSENEPILNISKQMKNIEPISFPISNTINFSNENLQNLPNEQPKQTKLIVKLKKK